MAEEAKAVLEMVLRDGGIKNISAHNRLCCVLEKMGSDLAQPDPPSQFLTVIK